MVHNRHNASSPDNNNNNNNNNIETINNNNNIFFPQFKSSTGNSDFSANAINMLPPMALTSLTPSTTSSLSPHRHPAFMSTPISPFSPPFNSFKHPSMLPHSIKTTPSPPKSSDVTKQTPPSPVTPLSKNSAKYSIENLLKDNQQKDTTSPPSSAQPAVLLTPPSSPQYLLYRQMQFQAEIEDYLLKVLEETIRRINSVPAFKKMSGHVRSLLLETSWLPLLLLGIFEASFPLESFTNYLLNTVCKRLSPQEISLLHHTIVTLERLRQCSVDKIELDLLKLFVLFNLGKQKRYSSSFLFLILFLCSLFETCMFQI